VILIVPKDVAYGKLKHRIRFVLRRHPYYATHSYPQKRFVLKTKAENGGIFSKMQPFKLETKQLQLIQVQMHQQIHTQIQGELF
jgi:hypothetical protein